jgi:hypothetical protein
MVRETKFLSSLITKAIQLSCAVIICFTFNQLLTWKIAQQHYQDSTQSAFSSLLRYILEGR